MTATDRADLAGKVLAERYQIDRPLGKKVGRQTWLARDRHSERQVVVKLLLFDVHFQWDDYKLFEREAEVLKSLEHPSIPRYLDFFELDETWGKGFALVQSYILAKSLEDCLRAGQSFSEADVREIARSLLQILQYLHDRKPPAIHRDIKPSNILLGDRSGHHLGFVYLVDFGSVQTSIAKQTGTMTIVGSYGYMPPEQFFGWATPASDLYGLGATLIRLVTGEHPADLPHEDLRIRFDRAADLSPGFSRWLQRILEPMASQRFASAAEALRAFDELATNSLGKKRVEAGVERLENGTWRLDGCILVEESDRGLTITIPPIIEFDSFSDFLLDSSLKTSFAIAAVLFVPFVLYTLVNFASAVSLVFLALMLAASILFFVLVVQLLLQFFQFLMRRLLFRFLMRKTIVIGKNSSVTFYYTFPLLPSFSIASKTPNSSIDIQLFSTPARDRYMILRYKDTCRNRAFKIKTSAAQWLAQKIEKDLQIPILR